MLPEGTFAATWAQPFCRSAGEVSKLFPRISALMQENAAISQITSQQRELMRPGKPGP